MPKDTYPAATAALFASLATASVVPDDELAVTPPPENADRSTRGDQGHRSATSDTTTSR